KKTTKTEYALTTRDRSSTSVSFKRLYNYDFRRFQLIKRFHRLYNEQKQDHRPTYCEHDTPKLSHLPYLSRLLAILKYNIWK
ncbi:hypothetical protein MOF48_20350, partial [Bacillus spizizenii]|nr:hypothetical protein [Bacillus spizizenii]